MPYVKLLYHIVFRTKYSKPVLTQAHERLLYSYIYSFIKNKGGFTHRMGGMPDHIHILAEIPPTIAISDFMRIMKVSTSIFLKQNAQLFPYFEGWANSYCALTYSEMEKEKIINYIKKQKEHHKKTILADEIRTLLQESKTPYNEEYFLKD